MPLESDVDRPVVHRRTARVLLVDPDGRVLLLEDCDPYAPGAPSFWVTPGGGLDPGESLLAAATREVAEETGLRIPQDAIRGPVAERVVVHAYSDEIAVQSETYFVTPAATSIEISSDGLTAEERATIRGFRWWSIEELRRTDHRVWPVGLADLVAVANAPAEWPVTLSTAEESTVPTNQFAR